MNSNLYTEIFVRSVAIALTGPQPVHTPWMFEKKAIIIERVSQCDA